MKKLFLALLFCLSAGYMYAQENLSLADSEMPPVTPEGIAKENIPTDSITTCEKYCLIVGIATNLMGFGTKCNVQVDFGESTSAWKGGWENALVDENGKVIKFNSMIDALNYLTNFGWKFVDAYAFNHNGQNVFHWLMKKDVKEGEATSAGVLQKRDFDKKKKTKKAKPEAKDSSFDSIYY